MNGTDVCALGVRVFLDGSVGHIRHSHFSYSNRQIDGALLILRVKNVKIME